MSYKKLIFPIIVIIICISGLIFTFNSAELETSLFKPRYLIIYFLFSVFYLFLAAMRTPIILGIKHYIKSFWIHRMALVVGSPTPVKLGIPLKIYLFKKYLNISIVKTTSAILYESLNRILVLVVLGILFGGWQYLLKAKISVYLLVPIFTVIVVLMLIINIKTVDFIDRIKSKISAFRNEFKGIFSNGRVFLLITSIQIIVQLIFIVRINLLLNSIGIESLTLLQISRVVITTGLITTISMIPGGYGIKDISMVYLLGVEGLDYPNAILVSLSDRSLQIGISMILGIFASLYFANINRKEGLNFINASE